MSSAVPLPLTTPVVRGPDLDKLRAQIKDIQAPKDFQAYLMTPEWGDALSGLVQTQTTTAQRTASTTLANQGASIGLTDLDTSNNAGLFVVYYFATVTVAAGVSSSLQVDIVFTLGGNSKTFPGTAMTGNTVGTVASQVYLLQKDANTPIGYQTTYASNPAGIMKYNLSFIVQSVTT